MKNLRGKNLTVLIDSWAWIEYLKGTRYGARAKPYIESGEEVLLSAINVSEIYRFLLRYKTEKETEEFMKFIFSVGFVIPLDTPIALQAARLKHELKLGLADAIVLATARKSSCMVVTGDDDFKNKEDVIYIGE